MRHTRHPRTLHSTTKLRYASMMALPGERVRGWATSGGRAVHRLIWSRTWRAAVLLRALVRARGGNHAQHLLRLLVNGVQRVHRAQRRQALQRLAIRQSGQRSRRATLLSRCLCTRDWVSEGQRRAVPACWQVWLARCVHAQQSLEYGRGAPTPLVGSRRAQWRTRVP